MAAGTSPQIAIYTDGACDPNPGPGGWAAILLRPDDGPQELSGAEGQTTNNRMELRAAVEALKALTEPHHITLHTDSQYLHNGATEWLLRWGPRDWAKAKNSDLWAELLTHARRHEID